MEVLLEQVFIYSFVILLCLAVVFFYVRRQIRKSKRVEEKIKIAKEEGLYEPVSLHPVVDPGSCIRTGACISACPEKDILGIVNGKATTINASHCVGHGACFLACPTEAITLCIGTEKRGVELPHVNPHFESNIPGLYIAGELGGMGLIKNAVEQGKQAVDNIARANKTNKANADYDLLIVGAGPAGISASLNAKKHGLRALLVEQDTLGGTVFTFPRSKIVMTSSMELPLYGKIKLFETSKTELLNLWNEALGKNQILVKENTKVEGILAKDGFFLTETVAGDSIASKYVLLATGRRGTPRKLGVEGETMEKVAYRLLEPELMSDKKILIVGGGDSAIESALLLADQNQVLLSYRNDVFNRLKPKNRQKIDAAIESGQIKVLFNSRLTAIKKDTVDIEIDAQETRKSSFENDLVYIFAGGELPTQFLRKIGLEITMKFGEAVLKHS